MRWLLLIGALSGCQYIFALHEHPDAAPNEASIDAPIDAPFDPSACPSGYIALPGLPHSKYKFVHTNERYSSHDNLCRLDGSGAHLVIIETVPEGFAIDMHLDGLALDDYFWLGATQVADASDVAEGWSWLSGRPVDPAMWGDMEPRDGEDDDENHEEDHVMMGRFGAGVALIDAPGVDHHFAICECDGVIVP